MEPMTGEPGNQRLQKSNPAKAIRVMSDTSDDFYRCYVGNCSKVELLRAYVTHEAENECRQDRIATANQRIAKLKD